MNKPSYDIIIFGASSFVGQILTRELAQTDEANTSLKWAIAGRSAEKLQALQKHISASTSAPPDIVIADALDYESLTSLCSQTRVVVSSVGPFALYGENLVRACAESGTDYCDITGEAHWVMQMISRYQEQAAESGARIVHSCGFDSIPSDLGVYFLQNHAQKEFGRSCEEINTRVVKLKGRFSGGTYASAMNIAKDMSENPGLRKAMASPYCFCPSNHPYATKQNLHRYADFDSVSNAWIAPFVMEGINVRTVHRSNALLNSRYGESFRYDEALVTGQGRKGRKRASRTAMGMWLFLFCASVPLLRAMLERWFLPKPGEGPSPEEQEKGSYTYILFGQVRGKGKIRCKIAGDRDPGYGSTAKILAQTALCLANDIPKNAPAGGFWTPASIFGEALTERLISKAGLSFSIEEIERR